MRISILLAIAIFTTAPIALSGPILTNLSGGQEFTSGAFSIGWQFTPITNVSVTALGVYDSGQDGLTESHAIGIFGPGGLVISTTVPSGTVATLDGLFRYTSISSTVLTAGINYRIASVSGNDPFLSFSGGPPPTFTVDPAINFLGGGYASGGSLADLTSLDGGNRRFGPNFIISESEVPEPSTWLLMGVGTAILLARKRREKVTA